MPRILIRDPASTARDGWHDLYTDAVDSLAGNVKKIFYTGIPQYIPTNSERQPDNWSCGAYSMAEALNQHGEDVRAWLLNHGAINPDDGTTHSGIISYVNNCGYSCSATRYINDQMHPAEFEELVLRLKMGYKAIILFGGTQSYMHCRTDYWSRKGHYCVAYGISDDGGKDSYMFNCETFRKGDKGNNVLLGQKLLNESGCFGLDGKPLKLDGGCGDNTEYAVRLYQTLINELGGHLKVTGVADRDTLATMIGL